MNDEEREIMLASMDRQVRRMKRDKKYAHEVYMYHGIMTKKGNLTRRWQQIRKLYGITPRYYEAIRRALA